jgi:hypothetical protein
MEIFTYLADDGKQIADRLMETAKNYSTWTRDRIFEEAKKAFESIQGHFSRVALLENNLKNPQSMQKVLSDLNKQRDAITADVEQIVEIHVDEPGFEQALEAIGKKFIQYTKYCQDNYFPAVKKNLSAEDLKEK